VYFQLLCPPYDRQRRLPSDAIVREQAVELVERQHRRGRIVDRGRERLERDVGQSLELRVQHAPGRGLREEIGNQIAAGEDPGDLGYGGDDSFGGSDLDF